MPDTVLLIFPRVEPDQPHPSRLLGFPLAPLALAGPLVAAGFRVRILDQNVTPRILAAVADEAPPLYVGFSILGGWQIGTGLALARRLRRKWPGVPFVWGGWSPTLLPDLWEQDELARWVDVVAQGRGEDVAVEIARALRDGRDPSGIPGVAWRDARGVLQRNGEPAPFRDLDPELAPYELIEKPEAYIAGQGLVNYMSSYGCPHRCAFCGIPAATRTFRPRANEVVVEHLRALRARGFHTVLFFDDNFFTSKARVLDLAQRLREADLDLSWYCNGRVDQVLALDQEELAGLAASGLKSINIGYETGTQAVADVAQKDLEVGGIEELARRFRGAGVNLSINFMIGLPGESTDDLLGSLATLHRIHALQPDLDVCWYFFMPAPGTPFWERLIAEGRLTRPRTLREHARMQTLHLELPWYYPSSPRSVLRDWRARHQALAWYFWLAWVAPRPRGLFGLPHDALRRSARWRLERRALRLRVDWLFFAGLFRVRTALRYAWMAAMRTAPALAVEGLWPARADPRRPSFAPLRSMHGRT